MYAQIQSLQKALAKKTVIAKLFSQPQKQVFIFNSMAEATLSKINSFYSSTFTVLLLQFYFSTWKENHSGKRDEEIIFNPSISTAFL